MGVSTQSIKFPRMKLFAAMMLLMGVSYSTMQGAEGASGSALARMLESDKSPARMLKTKKGKKKSSKKAKKAAKKAKKDAKKMKKLKKKLKKEKKKNKKIKNSFKSKGRRSGGWSGASTLYATVIAATA